MKLAIARSVQEAVAASKPRQSLVYKDDDGESAHDHGDTDGDDEDEDFENDAQSDDDSDDEDYA